MNKKQKRKLKQIIIATVLTVLLELIFGIFSDAPIFESAPWIKPVAYMIPYIIVGGDILKKAWKGILNRQVLDENFLMTVATLGALVLGEYRECVAVMLFYQVGELFQSYAVGKSRKSISELMDIRPDYANLEVSLDGDGINVSGVDPDEVAVGSIIVVNPGEKIPIDGVVVEGSSALNTASLTGESLPREVTCGSDVISGCINLSGILRIRTTKEFGESTVSKILDLVENASSNKSKSENFISKFARVYTPIVCLLALALAVIPPIINLLLGTDARFGQWIYRGLTFLVISCPCALVISIPLTFFAGIGAASRAGILVKGSNYLEALSKVKYVLFDKTGTVTEGVFEVTGIHQKDLKDVDFLEIAALVEGRTSHPIGKSIVKAYLKYRSLGEESNDANLLDFSRVSELKEISGYGISAKVDGRNVLIGNSKLMEQSGIDYYDEAENGTIVHMAVEGQYAGYLVISDRIKPMAKHAITGLKKWGVKKTVMLTGDAKKVAADVAGQLGIDEYFAELLPGDKVAKIEELINDTSVRNSDRDLVAFLGDGVNDAPVLTRADIGIAMGALGSDAAIEAADVVLMDDNLNKVLSAINIAQKSMRIVWSNIIFALAVKAVCLLLGALGKANMWIAIFADVGVMIIAVLNAIRALRVKEKYEEYR